MAYHKRTIEVQTTDIQTALALHQALQEYTGVKHKFVSPGDLKAYLATPSSGRGGQSVLYITVSPPPRGDPDLNAELTWGPQGGNRLAVKYKTAHTEGATACTPEDLLDALTPYNDC